MFHSKILTSFPPTWLWLSVGSQCYREHYLTNFLSFCLDRNCMLRAVFTWVPGLRVVTKSFTILTSETDTPPTIKMIRRGWSPGWGRFTCKMKKSIICTCFMQVQTYRLSVISSLSGVKLRQKYSWNAVAAESEINGDDAQLELINRLQGNKISMDSTEIYGSFSWSLRVSLSIPSSLLSSLSQSGRRVLGWMFSLGTHNTGDFKEWGVNYYPVEARSPA